jgi:hypothetical protein
MLFHFDKHRELSYFWWGDGRTASRCKSSEGWGRGKCMLIETTCRRRKACASTASEDDDDMDVDDERAVSMEISQSVKRPSIVC